MYNQAVYPFRDPGSFTEKRSRRECGSLDVREFDQVLVDITEFECFERFVEAMK